MLNDAHKQFAVSLSVSSTHHSKSELCCWNFVMQFLKFPGYELCARTSARSNMRTSVRDALPLFSTTFARNICPSDKYLGGSKRLSLYSSAFFPECHVLSQSLQAIAFFIIFLGCGETVLSCLGYKWATVPTSETEILKKKTYFRATSLTSEPRWAITRPWMPDN